ncbi:hypothetical protein LCGC14_1243380 [marine sediment metagenome]|uniref:Uncharacterized protein n=1 Tax=marine sediment metagenome TaxID=412755 RepID=A0A0F9P9B0_9ZZZZ
MLSKLKRTALREIARGMFDCKISKDAKLEINEDIIEGIYFVAVTTETGRILKFTVVRSVLEDLVKRFAGEFIERVEVESGPEEGDLTVTVEIPLIRPGVHVDEGSSVEVGPKTDDDDLLL